jgi:hypothetical protein
VLGPKLADHEGHRDAIRTVQHALVGKTCLGRGLRQSLPAGREKARPAPDPALPGAAGVVSDRPAQSVGPSRDCSRSQVEGDKRAE